MFKNISLGLGALTIALTAGMLAMPRKAEARVCKPTFIPQGFMPTQSSCGSPGCGGLIYTHRQFGSLCVITDFQP